MLVDLGFLEAPYIWTMLFLTILGSNGLPVASKPAQKIVL